MFFVPETCIHQTRIFELEAGKAMANYVFFLFLNLDWFVQAQRACLLGDLGKLPGPGSNLRRTILSAWVEIATWNRGCLLGLHPNKPKEQPTTIAQMR
jgi:hypothetical protein